MCMKNGIRAVTRDRPDLPITRLQQQHSRYRPALTLPPMLAATPGRRHQTHRLQRQTRHRAAQQVVVPPAQLLMEVLHREVGIFVAIQPAHPRKLALRRAAMRDTTEPLVPQSVDPRRCIARALTAEMPTRQAEQFTRFLRAQTMSFVAIQSFLETRHINLP
jgi:hypothetical protein